MKFILRNKSYTILEILMTIVIISIVSGIAVVSYRGVVLRAKLKQGKAQLEMIYDAQQQYYIEYDKYTDNLDELDIYIEEGDFDYQLSATNNTFQATTSIEGCRLVIDENNREVQETGDCDF